MTTDQASHIAAEISSFDARCQLMLDVTLQTLDSDPELRLCEGLRLIDATRTAVARLAPCSLELFERRIMPLLKRTLMRRFGIPEDGPSRVIH